MDDPAFPFYTLVTAGAYLLFFVERSTIVLQTVETDRRLIACGGCTHLESRLVSFDLGRFQHVVEVCPLLSVKQSYVCFFK